MNIKFTAESMLHCNLRSGYTFPQSSDGYEKVIN